MLNTLQCHPIGYFCNRQSEKYMAPKQPGLAIESQGCVVLNPGFDFEQALEHLLGFNRIWLIYWFHRNQHWRPKVNTPRGGPKRGLFATRSPHRPNPIGISCVELLEIKGRELLVGKNDLLDGTPILDIKPYLSYADAFANCCEGWTENQIQKYEYEVIWLDLTKLQADFIESRSKISFLQAVELRLRTNPFPFPNHRIKQMSATDYLLSFKTWRIFYCIQESKVTILNISSGYDEETLQGAKVSRWDDVPLHVEFLKRWPS